MSQSNRVHVQCEVLGKGMFPSEVVVRLETEDGSSVSMLVDQSLLEKRGAESFVRVTKIEAGDRISVCLLPTESTDSGSRWIRVKNSSLLECLREPQHA
jgi:hypothetical protein